MDVIRYPIADAFGLSYLLAYELPYIAFTELADIIVSETFEGINRYTFND